MKQQAAVDGVVLLRIECGFVCWNALFESILQH